LFGWLK